MKNILSLLAVLTLLGFPAQAAETAAAAKFPPAVVAVVDVQKILHESTAAKSVPQQLDGRRKSYQAQIDADEKKLAEAGQKLQQERATLKEDEFKKRVSQFEEQRRKAIQSAQARRQALDDSFNDAFTNVRKTMAQIIADIASAKGATVVLDKGQVVVVESSLDISAEVLTQLNTKLPRVDVKVPAENPAPRAATK